MPFKVFISYSTKDFHVVHNVKNQIDNSAVETFIAEYSVAPGEKLASGIMEAIKSCDLFILLWSRNSISSEWVPQEIGIAHGLGKPILPIVLESSLELPGFIKDLKYLKAYDNLSECVTCLKDHIMEKIGKQNKSDVWVLLGIVAIIAGLCLIVSGKLKA